MEIILPPIDGITLRAQSPLFSSMGIFESSIPMCSETLSASGIGFAFPALNNHSSESMDTLTEIGCTT